MKNEIMNNLNSNKIKENMDMCHEKLESAKKINPF